MSDNEQFSRHLSKTDRDQLSVLRVLSDEASSSDEKQYHISEITSRAKLQDEKEVQRYLFILEGQKLVSPYPAGDFTSKTWAITKNGRSLVKKISRNSIQ